MSQTFDPDLNHVKCGEPSEAMPREDQSEQPMSSSGERKKAGRPAGFGEKGREGGTAQRLTAGRAGPRLAWLSCVVGRASPGGQGHAGAPGGRVLIILSVHSAAALNHFVPL